MSSSTELSMKKSLFLPRAQGMVTCFFDTLYPYPAYIMSPEISFAAYIQGISKGATRAK